MVSAGVAIAGDVSKGSANAPLAEEATRINEAANQFVVPFAGMNNAFWNINVPGMAEQSLQFGLQAAPAVNFANTQALQGMLNMALPGYQQTVSGMQTALGNAMGLLPQMAAPISSMLAGQVPTDVQQQIQRSAAFTSMMGGTAGAGTGTTGAITARDLGLTSLDLEKTGMQQAAQYASTTTGLMGAGGNLLQLARNYLMPQPVNPMSLLPLSDLIQGTEWQKEAIYKANLAAYTTRTNAAAAQVGAPQQSVLTGVGGDISGLIAALSKENPDWSKTGFGKLGSLFGGGGGGGGMNLSGFSGGGGQTVGDFMGTSGGGAPSLGATSDFSSLFGGAMGV